MSLTCDLSVMRFFLLWQAYDIILTKCKGPCSNTGPSLTADLGQRRGHTDYTGNVAAGGLSYLTVGRAVSGPR